MSIKEITELLINAKRPIEIFGSNENEIKKVYRNYAKICHPDLSKEEEKALAEKATKILNEYYTLAQKEIQDGTYQILDEKEFLKRTSPLFEFELKGREYKFYKVSRCEDVATVYEGLLDEQLIELKIASDESDDDLIKEEGKILSELDHLSIPKLISKAKINGRNAVIVERKDGLTIEEIKKYYGNLSGEHICWILERLLSVVGYLHSKKIVHGNIKRENVLIDPSTHNVSVTDYSLCIEEANKETSKYKIVNETFSPKYVGKDAKVIPNVDIYAVGMLAIDLLGGDMDRVALPVNVDVKVRSFIRKLLSEKENDAWALWNELIQIRNEVYGHQRFKTLERKVN